MATKGDLQCNAADAILHKAFGELHQEMHAGFGKMYRLILQTALGYIIVNIAMVIAIFAIMKT